MNPAPRITLDQWRALAAVVEAGGYAKAAETLHKSQSTVTYAVQQIEAQLGVQAFRIEGRKARLTPTGELLFRRARYLLEEAAGVERSARRFSAGWEPEIRLIVEVVFPTWLLLGCLERFGKESPSTQIELAESVLGHRTDALAKGEADLAIFGSVPPGLLGEALMRVRFVLAAHPDHPLHKLGRKLTPRDFRPHRHLVLRESSPDRGTEVSMRTTQRWTVGQFSTLIEAARSGHGFAWLPEEAIRPQLAAGTLKPLPLHEGAQRYADLYLVFADREHAGPGTTRLAQIIRAAVASECVNATVRPRAGTRARKN
ncbi:MAG TPA: LysR family transcriptional regulator [Burkholderiaceae bacterium]|nr:LysR family transcriptional regulator [Burkholderiaceae bacterium]